MAWLPELFGGRTVERKDAAMRRAAGLPTGQYGRPYLGTWDVERAVRDGYERVIWVYRCVDAIASNISGLDFIVRKGHRDKGEDQPRHPLLPVLNQQVNPFETHEAFMYRLVSQYLLAKRGAFVEVLYDRAGNPRQLYLLPPHLTNPIPDPDTFVSGYEVRIGGFTSITVPATDEATGKPRVLWIRKPHPLDPYSGVTPLESAGLSIDTDYYARLYNRKFLANDGRPGGILAVKGDLDDDDQAELQRRFSGGPDRAGRTSVISAEDATFVDLGINHRDAQYVESMQGTKQDILLAFGTPESVLGNAANRTFDNADAEKAVFWQETLIPHMRLIAGSMDPLDGEPTNFLNFDTSTVTVLQRHQQEQEARLQALFTAGLISADEFRDKTGRDPYNVPKSRALWIPQGLVAIPAAGDEDDPSLAPPVPPGAMSPDGTPVRIGHDGRPLDPQPDEEAIAARQARHNLMGAGATPRGGLALPAGRRATPEDQQAALGRGGARPRALGATPAAKSAFGEVKALDQTTAGTMVAFFPTPQAAAQLALDHPDAEKADDLHVTLAYLGKEDLDVERLQRVVANFALGAPPVEAHVSGYGRFDIGDGQHAAYASIDAPTLPEWRAQLVATLEANGFEVPRNHGFTPHLTLQYLPADAPDPTMPPRLDLTFGRVTVAQGPQRQSFRLQAGDPQRKALPAPEAAQALVAGGRFVLADEPDTVQVGVLEEALRAAGFRPAS